jgi:hypothetical protein
LLLLLIWLDHRRRPSGNDDSFLYNSTIDDLCGENSATSLITGSVRSTTCIHVVSPACILSHINRASVSSSVVRQINHINQANCSRGYAGWDAEPKLIN